MKRKKFTMMDSIKLSVMDQFDSVFRPNRYFERVNKRSSNYINDFGYKGRGLKDGGISTELESSKENERLK